MRTLTHIHVEGYPYFVTTTTADVKVFSDTKSADALLSCIYYGKRTGWYLLLSFVIMPDHLHIIVVPLSKNISQIMKGIKGYSARMINLKQQDKNVLPIQRSKEILPTQSKSSQQQDSRGFLTPPQSIWQEGFYDYILDTEDKLLTKIKYIHNNPVKEGLVLEPELYPYSSAHKQNLTDLDMYLNSNVAGQECPAYPA